MSQNPKDELFPAGASVNAGRVPLTYRRRRYDALSNRFELATERPVNMAVFLQIAFYVALAALAGILVLGLINITRTDDGQASRSNKLMRARVVAQAVVITILVLLGLVLGAIKLF